MINVNFGDCFIIKDDSHGMVVDCGSRDAISCLATAIANIESDASIDKALLTHFHDDHYKGFNLLAANGRKQFSEIILPNVYSSAGNMLKQSIISLLFLSKTWQAWQAAFHHVTALVRFDKLLSPNGHFTFASDGASFFHGSSTYNVLSPRIDDVTNFGDVIFLGELENLIARIPNLHEHYNIIVETLLSQTGLIDNYQRDGTIAMLRKMGDTINSDRFESAVSYFTSQEAKNQIDRVISELGESYKKNIAKWREKMKYEWNKLSLVFKSEDNAILMTGDVSHDVWINHIRPKYFKLGEVVKIFKAPHHGTKSYFCCGFPINRDTKILISHNKYRNYGLITEMYPIQYAGAEMHCTNRRGCEFLRKSGAACTRAGCITPVTNFSF